MLQWHSILGRKNNVSSRHLYIWTRFCLSCLRQESSKCMTWRLDNFHWPHHFLTHLTKRIQSVIVLNFTFDMNSVRDCLSNKYACYIFTRAYIGFFRSQWPKWALITGCWPSTCFFTCAMGNAWCGSSWSFAHYSIIRVLSIFVFTVAALSCLIYWTVNNVFMLHGSFMSLYSAN